MEIIFKENTDIPMSFINLIKDYKIEIPKIQRDYAQGRTDKKTSEIRDSFLNDIIETISLESSQPLILDFIYGSLENNNSFIPLDGQQRLTTLFLIHWYLIPENKLELIQDNRNGVILSRFTYDTRVSSKDFCNKICAVSYDSLKQLLDNKIEAINQQIDLANKDDECLSELENEKKNLSISKIIKEQHWFMWAWSKDPTIKAMLVMIDDIDIRLKNIVKTEREYLWKNLIDNKVVFNLLRLEKFNLSDELYVKMNARGKELSAFDIFKSTMEEQMRKNHVEEKIQNEWKNNLDSNWVDIFWNKLAKPFITEEIIDKKQKQFVDSVEDAYLLFIKRLMVFHLYISDTCIDIEMINKINERYIPFEYNENNFLDTLRNYVIQHDILNILPLLIKTKFFKNELYLFIVEVFRSLIYTIDGSKHVGSELIKGIGFEGEIQDRFEMFIKRDVTYEVRVQFFAIIRFLKYYSAENLFANETLKHEFNSWMRVIRNLSTNTNTNFYNTFKEFKQSLDTINIWSNEIYGKKNYNSIIEYITLSEKLDGFDGAQLKEEQQKATLINKREWHEPIRKAEEHKYFAGQIHFLLEWSANDDNSYNISKFIGYFDRLTSVFDTNGLLPELIEGNVFRNALMSKFRWYLLNNCFIYNKAKDRDFSWKRYLRENDKSKLLRTILDDWDKTIDFKSYCKNIIDKEKKTITDWRKCFIEKPKIYDELLNHKINKWHETTEDIALLSKTRWSSKHKELWTFYWHLKYKNSKKDLYMDNTNEGNSFKANFEIPINFFVQFIPKWNDGWKDNMYLISFENDPKIEGVNLNSDTNRWVIEYPSKEYKKVDKIISSIFVNN